MFYVCILFICHREHTENNNVVIFNKNNADPIPCSTKMMIGEYFLDNSDDDDALENLLDYSQLDCDGKTASGSEK